MPFLGRSLKARLLNTSTTYTPRQYPQEVLNVEVQASRQKSKGAHMVELKSQPSYLIYEFLGPNSTFSIIVNALIDGI